MFPSTKYVLLVTFLALFSAAQAVVINEIMYDLAGSDTNREWIEVYNDESLDINLTGWRLIDGGVNHNPFALINGSYILPAGGFAVVAQDSATFLAEYVNFNGTLFDSSFDLSNSNESLVLKNSSLAVMENVTYYSIWGADGDGNSLQFFNGSWCEGTPTPGLENNCTAIVNATPVINISAGDCDLSLEINTTAVIYYSGGTIDYDLIVSDLLCSNITHSYNISYWIENFFGGFMKTPYNSSYDMMCKDTSSHQKQADDICGTEAYWIKAQILETDCNDTNSANNYDEYLIVVRGKNPAIPDCKTSTSTSDGTKTSSSISTAKNFEVKILNGSAQVCTGQSLITQVMLTNFYGDSKTFEIYSYAYKGQTIASEGGWVGNRQNITVAGSKFEIIYLGNKIKPNAKPDNYIFKVRAALGEEKSDAVSQITVLLGNISNTPENTSKTSKPKTLTNTSKTQQAPAKTENLTLLTGAVVWSSEKTSTGQIAMLLFIFVLLILVISLLASRQPPNGLK